MSDLLDEEILTELIDIMGDDMSMLLDSYTSDAAKKLEDLAGFVPGQDDEKIYRMAHSLKGSSRNVGVFKFANYCESLEKKAKQGELSAADFDVEKAKSLYESSIQALTKRLRS